MTATLSAEQHKLQLRANALALIKGPPAGWQEWDVTQARAFKDACEAIGRAPSLPKLRAAAGRIATYYGTTLAAIDPAPEA